MTGRSGLEGADSSSADLINVEASGPAKLELETSLVSE